MGEVYRARDTRLDRTVAIKVLLPHLAASPQFRARFEREARAISRLSHPHICTLYDIGEAPSPDAPGADVSYLVMELVEGETLAQRLERGRIPFDQALAWGVQIASALDKAHAAGVAHGDLKPGNIMVTKGGIKLLDFGLAVPGPAPPAAGWSHAETGSVLLDAPGQILGSLSYLSPEQLEGAPADARTDLFACGAVLFEMVTGRKAFDAPTQAGVIAAVMRQAPPPMGAAGSVPQSFEQLVSACLAKDPAERWQSAGDLARQLSWLAASSAGPSGAPVAWRLWGGIAAGTAAIVAALALGIVWLAEERAAPVPVVRSSLLLPAGLRFPAARTIGGIGRIALSPDGRRIALVAIDAHGNQQLWVRPLDALTATPLAGTDGASSPFWSPDSTTIAFFATGQLKTVDVAGGVPMLLASPAFDATGTWNPDGDILFTPTPTSPIHRVSASGGAASPVTALDTSAGDVLHRNPFFLPDGRHFLYVAVAARDGGTTGPRALSVGSLEPGEAGRVLVERAGMAMYAQGHLLLVRENQLMAQPFDVERLALSGEARPVADQVALVGSSGSAAFTVSSAGVLAYQPSDSGSQLVWFDRDGRQLGVLGDPAEYGDVELSPDGRRVIVSVLDSAQNTRDLWIFDIERGVRTRFTLDPGEDVSPAWSPDGGSVLFASNRRGHFDLYRKAVDGVADEALVSADASEKYPTSWLRDGRSVLYWSFDADGAGLSLLPIVGEHQPARILNGFANAGRFAPDGRWLAYHSAESGQPEVYVVPFPSASSRWQVSSTGGSLPRWRADSREIFYAGRDNRLMAVAVEAPGAELMAGPPRPLFEARPVGPRSFYAVSPDAQRFLVNSLQGGGQSSITVVQNWSTALKP